MQTSPAYGSGGQERGTTTNMTPLAWVMTITLTLTGKPEVKFYQDYADKTACIKAMQGMGPTAQQLLGERTGIVTARCDPKDKVAR